MRSVRGYGPPISSGVLELPALSARQSGDSFQGAGKKFLKKPPLLENRETKVQKGKTPIVEESLCGNHPFALRKTKDNRSSRAVPVIGHAPEQDSTLKGQATAKT